MTNYVGGYRIRAKKGKLGSEVQYNTPLGDGKYGTAYILPDSDDVFNGGVPGNQSEVDEDTKETCMEESCSQVDFFVDDCVEFIHGESTPRAVLFEAYKEWVKGNGDLPLTQKRFEREIERKIQYGRCGDGTVGYIDVRLNNTNLQQFIEECCVVGDNKTVSFKKLYDEYAKWAQSNSLNVETTSMVSTRLAASGLKTVKGSGGIRFVGIALKRADDDIEQKISNWLALEKPDCVRAVDVAVMALGIPEDKCGQGLKNVIGRLLHENGYESKKMRVNGVQARYHFREGYTPTRQYSHNRAPVQTHTL